MQNNAILVFIKILLKKMRPMFQAVHLTERGADKMTSSSAFPASFVRSIGGNLSLRVFPGPPDQEQEGGNIYRNFLHLEVPVLRDEAGCHIHVAGPEKTDLLIIQKGEQRDWNQPFRRPLILRLIHREVPPVLLVQENRPFKKISKILFIGNAPGMSDHPLMHRIAAAFLPRAYSLEDRVIRSIHWNNVCLISPYRSDNRELKGRQLNRQIQELNIDLVIAPLPPSLSGSMTNWISNMVLHASVPALVFPRNIFREADRTTGNPQSRLRKIG